MNTDIKTVKNFLVVVIIDVTNELKLDIVKKIKFCPTALAKDNNKIVYLC